jgi:hypothetical protein
VAVSPSRDVSQVSIRHNSRYCWSKFSATPAPCSSKLPPCKFGTVGFWADCRSQRGQAVVALLHVCMVDVVWCLVSSAVQDAAWWVCRAVNGQHRCTQS